MGFSADWLGLREPADRAARDLALLQAAAAAAGPSPVIMDLGCGTGATRRAFAGLVPDGTAWRLVDHDPALLAVAQAPGILTVEADLTQLDSLPWDGVTLVTCSALLDLVSEDWLDRLVAQLSRRGLPFYAALTYDGVMAWDPADPRDGAITALFNRHQRGDKGFGPALGPDATAGAVTRLAAEGHATRTAQSPWWLGPDDRDMQRELLQGIAAAASEIATDMRHQAEAWAAHRQQGVGHTGMLVGHIDLFATPAHR